MDHAAQPGPATAPAPAQARGGRSHRRIRNYLVDGALQLRLASYLVAAALLLCLGLGWLLLRAWQETSRVIALGDPDAGESIALALAAEDRGRLLLVAAALAGVLLLLLLAAVVITHRIAGPAFAIGRTCREVADGALRRPRPLRAGDLLVALAGDVATMVEALRRREAGERGLLLQAATTLKDAGAGAEARAAAAGVLERLAGEKQARLER